ncbi:MAG TPA: hypothetical protein VJ965_03410 [Anaerolineales bacterium]|nr:hypothetical protein [Anaerolineales bacterium]
MLSSTILWTLLLELSLLLAIFRFDRWLFGVCATLNLLTQLGLLLALNLFYPHYWPTLLVGEVLVVLVEAAGYMLLGRRVQPIRRRNSVPQMLYPRHALLLSLGLNGFSFMVGLALPY